MKEVIIIINYILPYVIIIKPGTYGITKFPTVISSSDSRFSSGILGGLLITFIVKA